MSTARLFASLIFGVAISIPSAASACWDGFSAQIGNVNEMGGDTSWDEATLRHHAKWLGRVNALLSKDTTVVSQHGFVTLTMGGKDLEFKWDDEDYTTLFHTVARHVGASKTDIERAKRVETPVYVVQAGAFIHAARANKLAETISRGDIAEHGFFQAGGFPADNPEAHVISNAGGRKLHRVYVGAFVNRAEAEILAKQLGQGAFVRELADRN